MIGVKSYQGSRRRTCGWITSFLKYMAILPVQVCGIRIAHSAMQLAASQGLPETLTGLRQSSIYFYPEGFARRVRRVLADRMKLFRLAGQIHPERFSVKGR